MRRGLRDHPADVVEPFAPRAAADLVKVARAQDAGLLPAEFAKLRQEHGADRHVDPHAERVRAADHFEQAALRELLHEHAVFRQQPGVVQPDPVPQPFLDLRPVWTRELEPLQRVRDPLLFLPRADIRAHEILRALRRVGLREMDDIDGGLAARHQPFQRLRQRRLGVGKLQRHRAVLRRDGHRFQAVEPRQFLGKKCGLAERRRHEQEARARQREQRHLPGRAALAVGIVVKLVHDHVLHVGRRAFAQRDVREDLRRAAEDRRVAIHRRVARAQPHIFRPKLPAEREPLFIHQRLDRAGVNRPPSLRQALEMQRRRDQRFPRAGGRVEDDVLPVIQFQNRLLLRRIEHQLSLRDVVEKPPQQRTAVGRSIRRRE